MKKKVVSILLATVLCGSLLAGCGGGSGEGVGNADSTGGTESAEEEKTEDSGSSSGEGEVLEFYHGYYQDESEWAAAQAMRDIYDAFAEEHADGNVTFKPIAVENRDDIVSAQVAGGSFRMW